jgi:hypothetical protein
MINSPGQINNLQIHEQTNTRIYNRNIPSQPLQPYLDSRPVLTKYSIMPIVDPRQQIETPLIQRATYTPETIFNPGNDFGPWSGYATNVNHESELRNQIYALQSCSQATYVPSSKSSLYDVKWKNKTDTTAQPFPDLFKQEQFSPTNPNMYPEKIGYALFNNSTRQQLKDLTK